ncbi:MAG: hypothetical protein NC339_06215 [Muribaculaceae bacterium]|nr:hypothetical protein [Muribaculaceae bacterium]
MPNPEHNITNETAIFNLWLNWIVAFGALCIPNIVSVYTPAIVVPVITFLLTALLGLYNNSSLRSRSAVCPLIPAIALRSLVISGLIMVLILISYSHGIVDHFFESELLNRQIPFLTVLIISPVTFVNALWAHLSGSRYHACRDCMAILGNTAERGFIGKLFSQESRYQRYMLLGISAVLSLVSWGYYLTFYINVNINVPDKFFLGWIPVILYFLSIVYLATRYFTLWAYYYQAVENDSHNVASTTDLRFLIVSGDTIFLNRSDDFYDKPDMKGFDTPAVLSLNYRSEMPLQKARTHFTDISQIPEDSYDLRFMYYSEDSTGSHNAYHFICCVGNPETISDESLFKGRWYNLSELERLLHNHELSPMLAAEIHRLYTVTMAWKTYDITGRRLYKVKNYKPLFRLRGICDWDVDFNSAKWLNVANLNEDKPLFHLRRFFNRLGGYRQ